MQFFEKWPAIYIYGICPRVRHQCHTTWSEAAISLTSDSYLSVNYCCCLSYSDNYYVHSYELMISTFTFTFTILVPNRDLNPLIKHTPGPWVVRRLFGTRSRVSWRWFADSVRLAFGNRTNMSNPEKLYITKLKSTSKHNLELWYLTTLRVCRYVVFISDHMSNRLFLLWPSYIMG